MTTTVAPLTKPDSTRGSLGMLRLPDLPPGWAAAARRCVNVWLGQGMTDPELADLPPAEVRNRYERVSYGDRRVRRSPAVQQCVSYYRETMTALLGPDTFPGDDVQIALRFPGQVGAPHLDGMLETGRLDDPPVPVAVLGVYLGDVTTDAAPLAYWPGREALIRDYARRFRGDPDLSRDRYRALIGEVTAGEPELLTGRAGSAFVFAGSVPHCNVLHRGDDVRYALYLRFYRRRFYPDGLHAANRGRGIEVLAGCDD